MSCGIVGHAGRRLQRSKSAGFGGGDRNGRQGSTCQVFLVYFYLVLLNMKVDLEKVLKKSIVFNLYKEKRPKHL